MLFSNLRHIINSMYKKNVCILKALLITIVVLSSSSMFAFSEEDILFNDVLTIATHSNLELLMYTKDGQAKGYCPELLNRIAELKNLTIKYKIFGPNVTTIEMAKDPDVDFVILSPLFVPEEIKNQCSNEFYYDTYVSITQQGEIITNNDIVKIGLIKIHTIHEATFKKILPKCEFVYYDTTEDILEAVKNGTLDIGLSSEDRANYLLRSPFFTELVLNNTLAQSYGMALWAVNAKSSAYIPIINDGIDLIIADGSQRIITANIRSTKYENSLFDKIYSHWLALVLFFVVIALLVLLYIKSQTNNKKLIVVNTQLKIATKKANAAAKAKTVFLTNMSHELRTPLNAILGLNTLLKDNLNNREVAEDYAEKIEQSSKILLGIINDIIDIAAIEHGKIKILHEVFNVKENIHMVTEMYYNNCLQKGIKYKALAKNIEQEMLVGDAFRLRQILLNLLSNAYKFTEKEGTITVNISEEEISDTHILLHLEVKDTGCGMSSDLQKRLFNKFEQEDATTVTKYGGSGLGLSITKNLIEMMNGTISFESKLKKGTTFSVSIPFEVAGPIPLRTTRDISKLSILIVDDDIDTCKYLSAVTRKWDMKTDYVTDSHAALKKIENKIAIEKEYDIYLIDIKMPTLNGFELVTKIKEIISSKSQIIMMSGYDISDFKKQTQNLDIRTFLSKPIFPSELFNAIICNLGDEKYCEETEYRQEDISLKGMQILLVEDNTINQLIAKKLLESKEALVTVANNGQEALDSILNKKIEYDVVLMDIQMPVMDGYEATRRVRAINSDYSNNLAIYAMTANSFKSDIEKALEAGMNGHIAKPIEPKALYSLLANIFKKI
ncbi:MAG: hypothetical protein BKP49_00145 [Treponema sp. CETP13]|nr:MAG: hypothetical protein BKP49_00145 [Treponema sp. CETP13]